MPRRKSGFENFGRGSRRSWNHPGRSPLRVIERPWGSTSLLDKHVLHLAALRTAAAQLDALLAASGVTEDELVNEFKEARRNQPKTRT